MAKLTIKPRRPLTIFLGPAHDADRLRACGRGRSPLSTKSRCARFFLRVGLFYLAGTESIGVCRA